MTKPLTAPAQDIAPVGSSPRPLSPGVRRHLGRNLRALYADTFSGPVSEHLSALLARLDRVRGPTDGDPKP